MNVVRVFFISQIVLHCARQQSVDGSAGGTVLLSCAVYIALCSRRVPSVRRLIYRGSSGGDRYTASGVRRTNEVNARRARFVRGWVTVFGRVYHLGM